MQFISYRYGLKYQTINVILNIEFPKNPDFSILDNFLINRFEIPKSNIISFNLNTETNIASEEENYLKRVFLCHNKLMYILNLPIFNDPKLIRLSRFDNNNNFYHAEVAMPFLDNLPKKILLDSIELVQLFFTKILTQTSGEVSTAELENVIQKKLLFPVKQIYFGGISALPMLTTANEMQIPFRHLGSGLFILGWGKNAVKITRSSIEFDSSLGAEISSRKDRCAELLAQAGVPVPRQKLVYSSGQAIRAAEKMGYPVVVKPANRERSEGVITMINDREALVNAYKYAKNFSNLILVESQIPGKCYRLLIALGKYLYCVERGPRAVIGDGKSKISQLIENDKHENLNSPFWRRKKIVNLDEQALAALSFYGNDIDMIPAKGVKVPLRIIESTEWSETSFDVTEIVHPANVELAERAAEILALKNAGIDLITNDITRPWWETGAVLTEVNYRPHFGASLSAKKRMRIFFERLIKDAGIIPIEIFIGDETALIEAIKLQDKLNSAGDSVFLCSSNRVITPSGNLVIRLIEPGLYGVCRVLLQNKSVKKLIVVIQDVEFIQSGLPFNLITSINIYSKSKISDEMTTLIKMLKTYLAT